ncbi:MAG: tetratricopeptide repeat protein [candidate division WOR-3 bacterium]
MRNPFIPGKGKARPQNEADKNTAPVSNLLQEALNAFYRDDDETALELFLELLDTNPDNLRLSYLTALCASLLNDEETLEEVCSRVKRKKPRHPYSIGCEAVRALYYANYQRAEHLFQSALRSLPEDIDLNLGLGILYEYMGSEEKCVEVYRRVLELSPDNIRARIWLGTSLALSGEFLNAFAEYQYAKRLDPNVENPHQHLGRDLYAEGLIAEAAQEFAQALLEEPDEPLAYFYLMDCYKRLNRFDEALDIYETIKQRFGKYEETLSQCYESFGLYNEAIPLLKKMVNDNPNDPELLVRLSQAYQKTGKIEEAIANLKRALDYLPDIPSLWTDLARLYYHTRDFPNAIAAAQQAINLNRYDQEAYGILADALLFLGRIDEAQAAAREMELARDEAWQRYQQRFAGNDDEIE